MANYATLKAAIQSVIKTNGNNEITGAILQSTLLSVVNSLGANYQFVGIASENTNPGTPDPNVFYIAGAGTYANFNNTTVEDGQIGVFKYNGSWIIETVQVGKNYDTEIASVVEFFGDNSLCFGEETDITGNSTNSLQAIASTGTPQLVATTYDYYYRLYPIQAGKVYKTTGIASGPSDTFLMVGIVDDFQIGATVKDFVTGNAYLNKTAYFYAYKSFNLVVIGTNANAARYTRVYDVAIESIMDALNAQSERISDAESDIQDLETRLNAIDEKETVSIPNNGTLVLQYIGAVNKALSGSSAGTTDPCRCRIFPIGGLNRKITVTSPLHSKNQYFARWGLAASILPASGAFIEVSAAATEATGKTEIIDLQDYPTANYIYVAYTPGTDPEPTVTYEKGALEDTVANVESMRDVEISLPSQLFAVVGDTLQIFYNGIIKAANPENYNIVLNCSKGRQLRRYFEYTPTSNDVGTVTFNVSVYDEGGKLIVEKECNLTTVNVLQSPASAKKFLIFGDSLTYPGVWPAELKRRLVGTGGTPAGSALANIAFCGSMSHDDANYFGVGGWGWDSYVTSGRIAYRLQVSGVTSLSLGAVYSNNGVNWTIWEINITGGSGNILIYAQSGASVPTSSGTLVKVSGSGDETVAFSSSALDSANPLWDGSKMTFVPYANEYSNGQIDAVFCLLGINGIGVSRKDFTQIIAYVKTFADTLHSEFPNAQLFIMDYPRPSNHGGLGYNYGADANGLSNRMGLLISEFGLSEAYKAFAQSSGYSFVHYIALSGQFDCDYNYPHYSGNVNTRNSAEKEQIDNNGIHPANSGYYQIADAIYRAIISYYCQ